MDTHGYQTLTKPYKLWSLFLPSMGRIDNVLTGSGLFLTDPDIKASLSSSGSDRYLQYFGLELDAQTH